jgi:hypothetical protein
MYRPDVNIASELRRTDITPSVFELGPGIGVEELQETTYCLD